MVSRLNEHLEQSEINYCEEVYEFQQGIYIQTQNTVFISREQRKSSQTYIAGIFL